MSRATTRSARPGFVTWRLATFQPRHYFGVGLMWTAFFTMPLASGLVLSRLFNELNSTTVSRGHALLLCAGLLLIEAGRGGILWLTMPLWAHWWQGSNTLVQTNVLRSLVGLDDRGRPPGPVEGRLPASSGEATSRCRDDVDTLVLMTDNWIDVASGTLFAGVAFAVMLGIQPQLAVVSALPLLAMLVVAGRIGPYLERLHRRERHLGSQVTGFIGELFAGVLTMKGSGASAAATERLRMLNRQRRDAAVRERVAFDMLDTAAGSTGVIGIGLVLVLAAPALQRGDFTVGELALFTTYLTWVVTLPETVSEAFYRYRQSQVATERLNRLLAEHEDDRDLVRHRPVWDGDESLAVEADVPAEPFRRLEVVGLRVTYPHPNERTGRVAALRDVDLTVERGSLTVITGAVGSGKTTLVRALLGLVPIEAGSICWNDRPVPHPELVMVPPRVAYAGQVPRLFSDTLMTNVLLGAPVTDGELPTALRLAALDRDIAGLPDGTATVIGSRGARLSGGQMQRTTAARALARQPELLVVDDLSSALDVETEKLLWDRLIAALRDGTGPAALLVVSHRRIVVERADQVLMLERGLPLSNITC